MNPKLQNYETEEIELGTVDSTSGHTDAFGRQQTICALDPYERYLRPVDGKLRHVMVQSFEKFRTTRGVPWIRVGEPGPKTPMLIRLSYWTFAPLYQEGTRKRNKVGGMAQMCMRWIPACIMMLVWLCIPQSLEDDLDYNGYYAPVRYKDSREPRVNTYRNTVENEENEAEFEDQVGGSSAGLNESDPLIPSGSPRPSISLATRHQPATRLYDDANDMDMPFDDLPARHLGPRYLCFLNEAAPFGFKTCLVSQWAKEHGRAPQVDFVFVSYTRKQFVVYSDEELDNYEHMSHDQRREAKQRGPNDRESLYRHGIKAAKAAGVGAFWLDFQCLRQEQQNEHGDNEDVWRICDIVRAANSMIIVLNDPCTKDEHNTRDPIQLSRLEEWGKRLWTLPELLLCPSDPIQIHMADHPDSTTAHPKRNMALLTYNDAPLIRQLIDHYESSIHLTPLELVNIALDCFKTRHTDQRTGGDMAYALMGLLRRRPAVNKRDGAFEAFARLSLANDSDKLLERLVCMLPPDHPAPASRWFDMRDAWRVHLWDVEPLCQIAGIVDDEAVILDGAYGATINWGAMTPPAWCQRRTMKRSLLKGLVHGVPVWLSVGVGLVIAGVLTPDTTVKSLLLTFGCIVTVAALVILLFAPLMLRDIYRGKAWTTQANFIGVEGRIDLGKVERLLFGFNCGRLQWSTRADKALGELKGAVAPDALDNPVDERGCRLFVLIDTLALTASAFLAKNPPTAVIVCGREGGMQRAVLCSYDWRTRKFCRETVLRMPSFVLDRMFRMDRFRISLKRPDLDSRRWDWRTRAGWPISV